MTHTTQSAVTTGYAPVNGLQMHYEVHGDGQPLVLLHGAFSAIGTSFGNVLPGLARSRQVIGLEMQAHGHTADIDRPLSLEQMADDTVAALRHLGIERADLFGYSMGAAVALRVAVRHPDVVRKLVLASVTYTMDGIHPGLMDGLGEMTPEMMHGSPWHEEYLRIAPRPEDFAVLFEKKTRWTGGPRTCRRTRSGPSRRRPCSCWGTRIWSARSTRWRCSGCSAVASSATPPPACPTRSWPSCPAPRT
jgi:pimeloyl-ACP methyl ester carboxylesterase